MKIINIFALILLFIIFSCKNDDSIDSVDDEEIENTAPSNFVTSVSNITKNAASLNWEESIDVDDDGVSYSIFLNEELLIENFTLLMFDIDSLLEDTQYSGIIVATDGIDETVSDFSFKTLNIMNDGVNDPPSEFDVLVTNITSISAELNWNIPEDPENDSISYAILIDGEMIIEELVENNYTLFNLESESNISGVVVATDGENEVESDFSFVTSEMECLPNLLQDGLLARYTFSNGSIEDSFGSNDLSNPSSASPTTDRAGNVNCAFEFDNSPSQDEFLTTTNTVFLNNLDSFSVSVWVYSDEQSGSTLESYIGRNDVPRCPDRRGEWSLGRYDGSTPAFGHNNSVWASFGTENPTGGAPFLGYWFNIVSVKENDTYRIYYNGNLEEEAIGPANCGSNPYVAQDIGDLFIGNFYNGKLDDIMIYGKALNDQEIQAIYNLQACCD